MKKPTKIDIAWAQRSLVEADAYAKELRETEGNRGAAAFLHSSDCVWRCNKAIATLRDAKLPLPDFIVKSFAYYRSIGWHSLPDSELAVVDGKIVERRSMFAAA